MSLRWAPDQRGAVAIETAIVAPVLALLSIGAFQVSAVVARQSELQSAAEEAEAIALASSPDTEAELITLKQVLMASARLGSDQVTLARLYRCDSEARLVSNGDSCGAEAEVSSFVRITLTDTYTPQWTQLGIGRPIALRLVRTVQLS